jgi:chitodextrinase
VGQIIFTSSIARWAAGLAVAFLGAGNGWAEESAVEAVGDRALGSVVIKDFRTGEIRTMPGKSLAEFRQLASKMQGERNGLQELDGRTWLPGSDAADPVLNKNFGAWSEIGNPSLGTYPRTVKLIMQFTDMNNVQQGIVCSGTLIDPRTVLTAGHCVFSWNAPNGAPVQAWADSITVYPGYDGGNASPLFKRARANQIWSWTAWTQNEDLEHDVGVIALDRDIGALAGWWGVGNAVTCSYFESNTWRHRVYPGANGFNGNDMQEHVGNYDDCGDLLAEFNTAGIQGTSGGGGIKDNVAWTVISHTSNGTVSKDAKVTADKLADIGAFMLANRPDAADLRILGVNTDESNSTVLLGSQLNRLRFTILNYGEATYNGSFTASAYLSTDNVINGSDRLIGTYNVNLSLGSLGTFDADFSGPTLPMNIATGSYFLGVVLNVNDANTSNNSPGEYDQDFLTFACPNLSGPALVYPADTAACVAASITLNWSDVANADEYEVRVTDDLDCSLGNIVSGTSQISELTVNNLAYDTQFRWMVRAKTACGENGDWSVCNSFVTQTAPVSSFNFVGPPDGDPCQDAASVLIDWDPDPDVSWWELRYWTQCGAGAPITSPSSQYTLMGLNPETTYFYQLRARTNCGIWGNWSSCRSFTTRPTQMLAPTAFNPVNGDNCVASSFGVSWNPVPSAASFEVRLGQSGGPFPSTIVTQNSMPFTGLAEGVWTWSVRSIHACGDTSIWSPWMSFTVDATPPSQPTWIQSPHPTGTWIAENQLFVEWEQSIDANCIVRYEIHWDTNPSPPTYYQEVRFDPYVTTDPLPDGQSNYVHMKTSDVAYNAAPQVLNIGPFWIDTTPPSDPNVSGSVPMNTWLSVNQIQWTFGGSGDSGSGLQGYTANATMNPNEVLSVADLSLPSSYSLNNPADGTWYFHILAADNVFNASPTLHEGPYLIDNTPPSSQLTSPNAASSIIQGELLEIMWDADDSGSGMKTMQLDYSTDGGDSWRAVTTLDLSGAGKQKKAQYGYEWAVPYAPTSEGFIRLLVTDEAGNSVETVSGPYIFETVTAISDGSPSILVISLDGNHPNPFNPRTLIQYAVPSRTHVELSIYDVQGRLVRRLVDEAQDGPAQYQAPWDGTADSGRLVASGVYYYRLKAGDFEETRRMTLLK